jgi:hypothetical protein
VTGLLEQNVLPIIAFVEFTRARAICYHLDSRKCFGGSPPGADNSLAEAYREEVPLMKTEIRILAVVVSLLMLVTGPLAPLASAQQPPPATEPTTQQPTPPQPTPQPMDPVKPESRAGEAAAYHIGAGVANVFYVPGKGFLCGVGAAVGIFILAITFGSQPKTAAYFGREGCGGRWFLTGDDLRPDADVRAFDWETDATKY